MAISNIKYLLNRNKLLRKTVPWLQKTLLVRIIHTFEGYYGRKNNKDNIENFMVCWDKHKSEFEKVYKMLEDEESKKTYSAVIKFRKTFQYRALKGHIYHPQYFVKEIFKHFENEVFVDGGAYIGDSALGLLKYAPAGTIKKIYAWEPDEYNGKVLLQEVKKASKNVEIVWLPYAMYKEKNQLKFTASGTSSSSIEVDGTVFVETDTIDNRCPDATFIKMDIEGAEIDALYGAKNTIIKNKPKLAICIYHSNEHLYEIPLLIHEWVPEYKLYVRHHGELAAETVLYAVMEY